MSEVRRRGKIDCTTGLVEIHDLGRTYYTFRPSEALRSEPIQTTLKWFYVGALFSSARIALLAIRFPDLGGQAVTGMLSTANTYTRPRDPLTRTEQIDLHLSLALTKRACPHRMAAMICEN